MNKRFVFIVLGIIIAIAGFWVITAPSEEAAGTPTNHTLGAGTTGVVLVEYADFQCPACQSYTPVLQEVKAKYGDSIIFQFRHFPLESLHKNARAAARAAEAAGLQGKFWEMHDLLFSRQQSWQDTSNPLATFEDYAEEIGIADLARFTTDYKSSTVNASINADLDSGRALGAEATPTFVLNGEKLDENPPATLAAFSALIDEAIIAKGGTPPTTESTTPLP
jgi:protein-disulfide isomerase